MTIPEMLAALFSSGMSQSAIAERAGVSQPTIYRASRGAALSYRAGKIIEALYLETKRQRLDEASNGAVSRHALRPDIFGQAPQPQQEAGHAQL